MSEESSTILIIDFLYINCIYCSYTAFVSVFLDAQGPIYSWTAPACILSAE